MKKIIISLFTTSLIANTSLLTMSCSSSDYNFGVLQTSSAIIYKYLNRKSLNNETMYTGKDDPLALKWIDESIKSIKLYDYEITQNANQEPKDNLLLVLNIFENYTKEYESSDNYVMNFKIHIFFNYKNKWTAAKNFIDYYFNNLIVLKSSSNEGGI
ncbi:hypothetical protein SLITO_v1c10780 [Spiroplasma litorale]|uniref:Lipoprotein n=1 Tax=Spiroplasma litorale TaxID=216942 RepID=A0A0K1W2Z1_9MOLU|nr:hypothetical protein [Spiroplasma litorale]AKX34689.1 hypothetical protein SLITO_v1c10780 [Spiroplasma litorale]